MSDEARAVVRAHFEERRAAVVDEFGEYGDDPRYTDYSTWLSARYSALADVGDAERAVLQDLNASAQPSADPQPVEDVRGRLLQLAAEAREVGDHRSEAAALAEVLRYDRRPAPRPTQSEIPTLQLILMQLVATHREAAGVLPLWAEVEGGIVEALPGTTKRARKLALARAGFGLIRDFQHAGGQLRLSEQLPPAQIEEG